MNSHDDIDADRLTGLPSVAAFHRRLEAHAEAAVLGGHDLALAVVDVDGFAEVNDALGFAAGDGLLRHLAVRLLAFAEPGEVVARLTADRFAWLLPGGSACDAMRAVDALRSELREVPPAAVAVRVSAGVCGVRDATHASMLLRHAENALRTAKARGGDAVCAFRPGGEAAATARAARAEAVTRLQEIAVAADARHPGTRGRAWRVAALADVIALELGWDGARRARLMEAAALHDLGRPGVAGRPCAAGVFDPHVVPDAARHAVAGAAIASGVLDAEQVAWIRHQHERWDGEGGPHGLAGDAIPEGARILAVAAAVDVTTRVRTDPVPPTLTGALAGCAALAGERFDPGVARALARVLGVAQAPVRAAGGFVPEATRGGAAVQPLPA
ncbi:MAG: diguanylate cyclase [Thermoleophilia bacterium]|nr:diguanylate cyclase [Thermoleophilia bacterium]